ncbi:TIGR04104 family putative zinc finger protein [Psychrobacillus sp. L4]|uniref:TIGR04104 family putative zinc finger protein n=1 Tax=Psychrobacillus sp. L4 TaxID=3236892 RepID=UPI0036F3CA63
MTIQKCDKCNKRFSWSKIYKYLIVSYRPISCSQCNTPHRITFFSRIIVSIVIVLPLSIFLFLIPDQLSLTTFTIVSCLTIYFAITSAFFPFLVKYNSY